MIFRFLRRLFGGHPVTPDKPRAPAAPAALPEVDPTPDSPQPFGYKTGWIAVRAEDPLHVATQFRPVRIVEANWETGLRASRAQDAPVWAFVTPPQEGWVFVCLGLSVAPDHPEGLRRIEGWLNRISKQFGDAQYFGSYRVVGFIAWMRSEAGRMSRAFSFADGQCFANAGPVTEVERDLGWAFAEGLAPEAVEDGVFAALEAEDDAVDMSEEAPLRVARDWSRSPEDVGSAPSSGLLIRLPD